MRLDDFEKAEEGREATDTTMIKLPTSTITSHQELLAYAIETIDPKAAEALRKDKNFRKTYTEHIVKQVEISLSSPEAALLIAQRGLDWIYQNYSFNNQPLFSVKIPTTTFTHISFTGKGKNEKMMLPYNGEKLTGTAITNQLDSWTSSGTIEPGAKDAILSTLNHPEWIKNLKDTIFVCLGGGSAMSPTLSLLSMGLHVVVVDLDGRPNVWNPLIQHAKRHTGTLTVPVKLSEAKNKDVASHCGANLLTDTLDIIQWLSTLFPTKKMVIGSYAYLDGVKHVQISVAMDMIVSHLIQRGRVSSIAYLCTPTDVHVIPDPAKLAAEANYQSSTTLARLLRPFLDPNVRPTVTSKNGDTFAIVDALMIQQGVNYAVAKRIQHWRAMVARSQGIWASSNVAPMTNTVSVTHNRLFRWAYSGAHFFRPAEIFEISTSATVMTWILLHDISDPKSSANPNTHLRNPLELFSFTSFNGGVWRNGFKINDVGTVAAVLHLVTKPVGLVSGMLQNVRSKL